MNDRCFGKKLHELLVSPREHMIKYYRFIEDMAKLPMRGYHLGPELVAARGLLSSIVHQIDEKRNQRTEAPWRVRSFPYPDLIARGVVIAENTVELEMQYVVLRVATQNGIDLTLTTLRRGVGQNEGGTTWYLNLDEFSANIPEASGAAAANPSAEEEGDRSVGGFLFQNERAKDGHRILVVNVGGVKFNVKALTLFLRSEFPTRSGGGSSVEDEPCVLNALLGFQSLTPDTLKLCEPQNLIDHLAVFLWTLRHVPGVFQVQMRAMVEAIKQRAAEDNHIAQSLEFAVSADEKARGLVQLVPKTDASTVYSALAASLWKQHSVGKKDSETEDGEKHLTPHRSTDPSEQPRKSLLLIRTPKSDRGSVQLNEGGAGSSRLEVDSGMFGADGGDGEEEAGPGHLKKSISVVQHGLTPMKVSQSCLVLHPFQYAQRIATITPEKVFKSNAKPVLLRLEDETGDHCSRVIFKYGDDLKQDMAAIALFNVMNRLWKSKGLKYRGELVQAPTYQCVAIRTDLGFYEYVSDCQTLKEFQPPPAPTDEWLSKMVATASASYLAAWVVGVRDRHNQNILIHEDGRLYQIDFGYILGEKVRGVDTGPFAITHTLKRAMGKQWDDFIEMALQAFEVLQSQYAIILNAALDILGGLYEPARIQAHFAEAFFLDNPSQSRDSLNRLLRRAPNDFRTIAKNRMHGIAQIIK
eukprot:c12974_g1_i2.p1 GENE.c12974_g1_i2~~c12974_g1_i2.p1  ORF type:complete len:696 (+),score=174.41 c12974_g1_i2:1334-3421(+)